MKSFRHKSGFALSTIAGLGLSIGLSMAAPQVFAHDRAKAMEQQIKMLESQLKSLREDFYRVQDSANAEKREVEALKEEVRQEKEALKKAHAEHETMEKEHDELGRTVARRDRVLFFRGGYAHNLQGRNGSSIQSNVAPVGVQEAGDNNGWYVGAGLDWSLTRDVWGLIPKTNVYAELMFEYKKFGVSQGSALANVPTTLVGAPDNPRGVTISQFTVSAAPKIKFMEGSDFRPWIIPAGFAVHVVSPTTESVTYLAPGMMFGAGFDYRIWKEFFLGADARYHETFGKTDGVNVSGLTAGAYLGIGF